MPIDPTLQILQTLNAVGREVFVDIPQEEALGKILAAGMALMPVAVCCLWRRDASPAQDVVRLDAISGEDGRRPFPRAFQLAGGIGQCVLETRRSRAVPDLAVEPWAAERDLAAQRGLVALLCAPAAVDEGHGPAGLLMCFAGGRHVFTAVEILVAEALARLAGLLWYTADMRRTAQGLREELQTRKRVDRAKDILMDRRKMTAEEAYRWIQKRSMDSRRSMRDVAETIILSDETGHYTSIPHALDLVGKPFRK